VVHIFAKNCLLKKIDSKVGKQKIDAYILLTIETLRLKKT